MESPIVKPKSRSRQAKSRPGTQIPADSDELVPSVSSDVQDVAKTTKAKRKAKAVDHGIQVADREVPTKQHGKRKASSREDHVTTDVEILSPPAKNKNVSRALSEARVTTVTKSKPRKAAHRGGSVQPSQIHEEDTQASDGADFVPKKKKRKINLFPTTTEPTTFNFTPPVW